MNVVLFCCSGYSSSILIKNIQHCIQQKGMKCKIEAHAICESKQAQGCDVILLTPQVRFNLDKIKSMYPDIPAALIHKYDFEAANGEAILEQIKDLYK